MTIPEINPTAAQGIVSGIGELDRVLGGQILPGMTILLGGDPGIGKSTLVLQAAEGFSRQGMRVLYASGEESAAQLKLRSQRLDVTGDNVAVVTTTDLEEIHSALESDDFQVAIVDSIQTVSSSSFDSPPGTVAQVREAAARLNEIAKIRGTILFLIGHVTKEGMVAGPKVLEHMVDTVVYFEGDPSHLYRVLRTTKNRFGSTAEIGLFEMSGTGLQEVTNPSSLFLSGRDEHPRTGAVVTSLCEGNRPILVEIQALVTPATYGSPQRVAGGLDHKRLALLLAVLEKRCDLPLAASDVFVSTAGGLRLSEPAVDLPLVLAMASSHLNRPIDPHLAAVGEVGLSGEVRGVGQIERRLNEAARLGFKRMLIPNANADKVTAPKIDILTVTSVSDAIEMALS
jgi:DNA repair protein RadA/Sms